MGNKYILHFDIFTRISYSKLTSSDTCFYLFFMLRKSLMSVLLLKNMLLLFINKNTELFIISIFHPNQVNVIHSQIFFILFYIIADHYP